MTENMLTLLNTATLNGEKLLAVLLDPDKADLKHLNKTQLDTVDIIFVGSSILTSHSTDSLCKRIKELTDTPIVLFPGNYGQITPHADAILFLSLISGRNAEYLIGQQVIGAPLVKQAKLECIPTGYMLIGEDNHTAASYITQSAPIPHSKTDIGASTALAGEMLGLKCIYIDGGSGARTPISEYMIRAVKDSISIPLIVGGGIRSIEQAELAWEAGADVVVIGTVIEKSPELFDEFIVSRNVWKS